jgi:hypothetical protein
MTARIYLGNIQEAYISKSFGDTVYNLPYSKQDLIPVLQAQGMRFHPTVQQMEGWIDEAPLEKVQQWVKDNPPR